jgi:uncharacterized protein (DUF2252 family)
MSPATPGDAALPTAEDRARDGRRMRTQVPPDAQADLVTDERDDPVQVIGDQVPARVPELVPLRHTRMSASPFAFFRGAAAVMAGDLARGPSSGLTVQLCGDAHLSNFGIFASPERRLVFDLNDFDETFPGPWEWDVKRLAASLVIAGRQNDYSAKQTRNTVLAALRRYQQAMAGFAGLGNLAVWYASADVEAVQQRLGDELDKTMAKRLEGTVRKARGRDHLRSLAKLTTVVDGRRRFIADPPLLVPLADVVTDRSAEEAVEQVRGLVAEYSASLEHGRRELVQSYAFVDMARKVVGVGSVGTRCWVVLMQGRDENDPLLLQVKEAQPSVLARHLGQAATRDEGARVVAGQRILQATPDTFLGSQSAVGLDGRPRDFYVRQLHDWKGSAQVDVMLPKAMRLYGQLCAWTLARAHARSGDRIAIAAYLGDDDSFAQAVAGFADAYADLNERDFTRFAAAVQADELLGHNGAPDSVSPQPRPVVPPSTR